MVSELIIGSSAIRYWFPDFPREPKDLDVWTRSPSMDRTQDFFWDDRLDDWFAMRESFVFRGAVAHPAELYTMKVSHASWDLPNNSWPKHMHDIVWLKARGARLVPEMWTILQEIWKDRHGRPKVNLNQESGAFFTDAVVRIFDHDSIHDTVAHYERPLWIEVLKDGESVAMDMAKVWALDPGDQVRLFREEVYATALERWLIPAWERGERFSPTLAYMLALRKTITSLTKGQSSRFMIENYEVFRDLPRLGTSSTAWYIARHEELKGKLVRL